MSASAVARVPQAASARVMPVSNVTGWRRHYLLLVLLLVYGVSMIDRQIMGVLIQPIKQEMGVSDSAMGLLTGLAFALFYSILAVPFGRFADRTNRRNLIAWCCAGWGGGSSISARMYLRTTWDRRSSGCGPRLSASRPARAKARTRWGRCTSWCAACRSRGPA